jgi:hypothetical protein
MTNIEWATWAAAVGTFVAAVAAVGIAIGTGFNERRRDREREWRARRDQIVTDIDETRRLLIAVTYRRQALGDPVLFGTIVHSLAKHSHLMDIERAAQLLDQWGGSESSLDEMEKLIRQLDTLHKHFTDLKPSAALEYPDV